MSVRFATQTFVWVHVIGKVTGFTLPLRAVKMIFLQNVKVIAWLLLVGKFVKYLLVSEVLFSVVASVTGSRDTDKLVTFGALPQLTLDYSASHLSRCKFGYFDFDEHLFQLDVLYVLKVLGLHFTFVASFVSHLHDYTASGTLPHCDRLFGLLLLILNRHP